MASCANLSVDGVFGYDLARPNVLDGRLPRRHRSDEILVADRYADTFGVGVGDRLDSEVVGIEGGPQLRQPSRLRRSASAETRQVILQRLFWLLRPFFAANHVWAMKRGEESLKLELRRRRAATSGERAKVPPPPSTTFRFLLRKPTW